MTIANDLEYTEVDVAPVLAAKVSMESASSPEAIGGAMGNAFGMLMGFIQSHGLIPTAPPRAIYTSFGPEGTAFTVAMPISAAPAGAPEKGPVLVEAIPGARAMRFTHRGPYPELMRTYGRITQLLQLKNLMQSEADWAKYMPMWEEYLNDPQVTPESELLTYIYLPIAAER